MTDIFLGFLNRSLAAGILILAVVLVRLVFKKAPRWLLCALWALAAVRLVCPVSIESVLSLIPSAEPVQPEIIVSAQPAITSGIPAVDAIVNPPLAAAFTPSPAQSANPLQIWTFLAACVWLAGIAALLLYAAVSALRLRLRVRTAVRLEGKVYQSEFVSSPFILGVIRPRIYLPFGLEAGAQEMVLAHERAHLRRGDQLWKPLGYLILTAYWFNPVCWLAYILFCRDIEAACDEKVVRELGEGCKAAYSRALLACSVPRRMIAACPLAFGEVGVGARVKNALRYKKPAFWVIAASVIVCIVVAVCFLTNPRTDTDAAGLVGFYREQVTYADVTDESGAQPSSVQLTAEETDAVYALLDTLQYKRLGTASAMQDCYARLYFISAAGERCEVMLSEREMLVNPITDGRKARLYELRSGSTELRGYLLECIGASEAAEDADRVYTDAWSIRVLDGWEREGDSPLWRSGAGTGAYFLVTEGSGLDDKLMELYSAGWTLKYFSDHYRCTLREGESGTMLSFYPRPEGGFYQIESYWSYEGADKWQVRLEEGQLKVMEQSFRLRAAERGDPQDSEQAPAAAPWDGTMPDMPPTDTGGAQDSDEREEQRTEEDTAGSAYSVKVYAMTAEERSALDAQTEPAPAVGTAFLPRSSRDGASGNVCAPFTAKTADVAFVLYSAPGATDYNVRLCAGEPGAGKWASKAVTVKVNDGVRFSGLTVGQAYYMEVSSDTLSTAGCTALYKCATTPPPARSGAASTTGYAAYDALLAEIADLRRSGASDVQTDFSHDLLSVNDYYQTPGWLLRDLEGDGTSELLLGADWGDGCGVIFNIYRLDGAKAVRVVDGWSRSQYFLCSDGTLAHEWSGGADHWGRTYLRYGEALLPIESVFDRGGVWYHAKGLDALSLEDTQLEDRCKTISRAEAEQLMERYTKQYEALPFTPFAA